MTNFEYILKNRPDLVRRVITLAAPNINRDFGEDILCAGIKCLNCDGLTDRDICQFNVIKWLDQEHIDTIPENTPVDTLILVSDFGHDWLPRYFAKFEDGKIYAWNDGATSFTARGCASWEYAKLYRTEQEKNNDEM